jgi:hypothetical protein
MAKDQNNVVFLAGTVLDVQGNEVIIETKESTPRGDFTEQHLVQVGKLPDKVKAGTPIALFGSLQVEDGENFVEGDPESVQVITKKALSELDVVNQAQVIAKASQGFDYFPPAMAKKAFGNMLLKMGEQFYVRGVAFGPHASFLNKKIKTGALVKLVGRLQNREFEDRDTGETRTAVEIIANKDFTEVLAEADSGTVFDKYLGTAQANGKSSRRSAVRTLLNGKEATGDAAI